MNDSIQSNEKLSGFFEEARGLQALLDQLTKFKTLDIVSNKMTPLDYAQLSASIAYSLNSLRTSNYILIQSLIV